MVKKQNHWYFSPGAIVGAIAIIGTLGTGIVKSAIYITLPDRVMAQEAKVETIEDYIQQQVQANELLQQIVTKQEKKEVILSPDGKRYWNSESGEWRPIKELKGE